MAIRRKGALDISGSQARIIRFKPEYADRGFYVLLVNGQSAALPNDTYVVGDSQLELLKRAKIPYKILNEEDL